MHQSCYKVYFVANRFQGLLNTVKILKIEFLMI